MITTSPTNPNAAQYQLVLTDPSNADAVDPAAADAGYLTPDALMAYCQSRLSSIDDQIGTEMQKQRSTDSEQQLVNDLSTMLQGYAANGTTQPGSTVNVPDPAGCVKIETQFDQAIQQIKQIDPGSPAIAKLEQIHDDIMATGAPATGLMHGYYGTPHGTINSDSQINANEVAGFLKDLDGVNTTLNSSAELGMIQLQSLMSQRQTAIQLTTNLVQSLGDQLNKIADNIGH